MTTMSRTSGTTGSRNNPTHAEPTDVSVGSLFIDSNSFVGAIHELPPSIDTAITGSTELRRRGRRLDDPPAAPSTLHTAGCRGRQPLQPPPNCAVGVGDSTTRLPHHRYFRSPAVGLPFLFRQERKQRTGSREALTAAAPASEPPSLDNPSRRALSFVQTRISDLPGLSHKGWISCRKQIETEAFGEQHAYCDGCRTPAPTASTELRRRGRRLDGPLPRHRHCILRAVVVASPYIPYPPPTQLPHLRFLCRSVQILRRGTELPSK